ncbi:MAG: RdgB/HAM1 family non-canonical purine NTP pyrophosphatase [Chloroflexota bacterium]|nr:RdgB/HAM1 family non-canonical purine NTP pyrophosphatase [Chloroflexota bacterium]
MRRLLVATRSRHKLAELRALLKLPHTELLSLEEVGVEQEASEDAQTFEENAVLKARFYAAQSGLPTLADDSGLEVDALGGRPGVRTRRYAGETATDEENNRKLLEELTGVPAERRTARYRCALAYLEPGTASRAAVRVGALEGRIAEAPKGSGGFGYDPIFEPSGEPPGGRTVGELSPDEKNAISHRALAARAMAQALRAIGY